MPGFRVLGTLNGVELQTPKRSRVERRPRPSTDRWRSVVRLAVLAIVDPLRDLCPNGWPIPVTG